MTILRIALLGLGDIAKKAYLPIVATHSQIEPILCSRNNVVLSELQQKYRIKEAYQNLSELIASKPDAIMIHSSTESHFTIAKQCLRAKIATFVDKPISLSLSECEELVTLAKIQDVPLYVGFNRRKAPLISAIQGKTIQHIHWQKNRVNLPSSPRDFIFNDFIHVVDGLLFLAQSTQIDELQDLNVNASVQGDLLTRINFSFTHHQALFEGSMNRLSGLTEERIEAFLVNEKYQLDGLTSGKLYQSGAVTPLGFSDWQSNLYQRGFNDMIEDWLLEVKNNQANLARLDAILASHQLCEKLVTEILST
jgi:virulence factor